MIKNVYDDDDNIIETHYQNEKIVQNDYDGYGNLSKTIELLTDETGAKQQIIHNYSYDKFGNVIKEETTQHAKNFNIINEYDINNNIDSTTFQIDDKNIFYNYTYSDDPEPKLVNILLPNNSNQSLHYDKLNRLDKIALLKEEDLLELKEFEYLKIGDHTSNLVSKLKFSDGETYNDILKYKYDEKGNITEIRQNNKLIARYKYDSLSRLVREDNLPFNKTFTYEYDAGGNILCRTEYSFTLAENLENLLCQTFDYSYFVSGWRDQLKSYNGESFKYDLLGNPETYRGKNLTWSHGRQLDKFGDIASYTYNASGIRTSKRFDNFTTSYYLNGNKILVQKDASNIFTFYYGESGVIGFHLKSSGAVDSDFYYKKNAQNDIIGIYSTSGEEIAKYEYDAWGNCVIKYLQENGSYDTITSDYSYNDISIINRFIAYKNPFRYRSYYYDFETNLYYLNSRYYDPELGRFINADDISTLDVTQIALNGLNLYAYCLNNPVNETDENGYLLLWLLLVGIITGAVIGGTINGIKAYKEGARGWGLFGAILGGAILGGTMGGLLAFGGAAGLGIAGSFTFGSGFLISAGIGIVSGWVSYSVEVLFREDKSWNIFDFAMAGISGMFKGVATFGIGFWGGHKLGAYDKLILKPFLKDAETLDYSITYGFAKALLGRNSFLTPFSEFILKSILLGGLASGVRFIIDKILGT